MRFGVLTSPADAAAGGCEAIAALAQLCEGQGIDLLWLTGSTVPAAVWAAAVAGRCRDIFVAVEFTNIDNPVDVAEEISVLDHLLGGRLVAVLDPPATRAAVRAALRRVLPPPSQLVVPLWTRQDASVDADGLRVAIRELADNSTVDALAAELARDAPDVCVFPLPPERAGAAVRVISRELRPRVYEPDAPPELADLWRVPEEGMPDR